MKTRLIPLVLLFVTYSAFGFSVNPMVAEFDPDSTRSQQVFVLTNPTEEPKPVEITVGIPHLDEKNVETLERGAGEENFLIVPQQLIVPPNSKRSVKVFWVGESSGSEETFRIIFKELPVTLPSEDLGPDESSFRMMVTMEYQTRIWVTPKGLKENLSVTDFDYVEIPAPRKQVAGEEPSTEHMLPMLKLTVANTGQRHGYIRYPEMLIKTKTGDTLKFDHKKIDPISGQVVMKESERSFKMPWRDDFPNFDNIDSITLKVKKKSR